jgi:thiol-disulfide isomerase/thioredoxin
LRLRFTTLAAVCAVAIPAAAQEPLPELGKRAAMFRLMAYNPAAAGQWVGLDKFVGDAAADKGARLVLLSFMASFCAPCKKELPALQRLHEKYAPDGLRVVLVSVDDQPEGMKIIEGLIAEHKVTFPVLKDRTTLVARRWLGKESPLPSVFFIQPDARVSLVHRGYDEGTSATLEKEIRAQLGKAP